MAGKKSTRRNGLSLFSRVWAPFGHLLQATGESGKTVGSTAGKIVKESVGAVREVGSSFAKHANMAVRNVTRRRNARKDRKSSRRHSRK